MLERGMVREKLQSTFLQKLSASTWRLSVLTLGGSFTRGHGCGETLSQNELECAWPARLERWWKNYLEPHLQIQSDWYHKAEHGSGSLQALQRIGVLAHTFHPDLIILDFLVNDVAQRPREKGTIAFEALLRTIRQILPDTQILLMEAGCPYCLGDTKMWFARRRIAKHYQIPILDYAAIVDSFNQDRGENNGMDKLWPFTPAIVDPEPFVKLNQVWPNFWPEVITTKITSSPLNHPPWPVHQYTSDSVAYLLLQLIREQACGDTHTEEETNDHFYHPNELAEYKACTTPLTNYDAAIAFQSQNSTSTSTQLPKTDLGWTLSEDKKGRPGWIATTYGASIRFPLTLGPQPTIAITYLKSYDDTMGTATVTLKAHDGTASTIRLDGHWDQPYSLPHTDVFIGRPDAVDGNLLYPLEKDGYDVWREQWRRGHRQQVHEYEIKITLRSQDKFKILQVVSC